jgi:NodT family efflux transporter outer membrane factor (OMF) lipoprotein
MRALVSSGAAKPLKNGVKSMNSEWRGLLRGVSSVSILVALGLTGCTVGPNFQSPAAPKVSGYTNTSLKGTVAAADGAASSGQRFAYGADVPGEWWTLFRSKQINALVAEAIANHPSLESAQATLRQAREVANADAGGFFPSANAQIGAERERVPGAVSPTGQAIIYNLYNTNVPVSYTPDVFGKVARTTESDEAAADNARFELEAAYLSLTANVVTAAINDASYAEQIKVTQDIIDAQKQQVDLLDRQFQLGAVGQADVLSEKAQLAQTLATLPPLQKLRAQGRNQLMALVGRLPSQDHGESVTLAQLNLPRSLPVSLPSKLVRQRPDIQAAEAQMHEASAKVGVATASMLPQISLSAALGTDSLKPDKLFFAQSAAYDAAASASAPIFDAGSLYHNREAAKAAFDAAQAQYRSTVITAFQNVADALRAVQADAATLKAEVEAENTASDSLNIAKAQFSAGSTTFQTVLTAEQTLLTAKVNRARAEAARYADSAALFQAVGGGWWNRIDETPASMPKPADPVDNIPLAAGIRAATGDKQ